MDAVIPLSRRKHGFEPRWGHHFVSFDLGPSGIFTTRAFVYGDPSLIRPGP